ncbi:hypothetical protein WJX75_000574 [Coccomyxa subellipsoidea]|uniref:Protein kinase domain-containing protein n=1 Tax=Coccomyxa subellipsoidea TaxID=248742 RepID=A0ABR2YKI9_9CHLO
MQERKICFGDFGIVDRDHHDHNDLTALREELEGTRYRLSRLLRAKNEEGPTLLFERDVLLFECGHLKLKVEALQEQISQLAVLSAKTIKKQSEEDDDQEALQLLGENGQLKNFPHEASQQQAAAIQALVCERERLRAELDLSQHAVACAKQLPIIPLAVQETIRWGLVAEGGFSEVCVGSLRVAAKVPKFNTPEYQASVDTEAATLMGLSHPNILRPLAMIQCSSGQRAMLMEFFERGTLQDNFRSVLTGGTLPLQEQLQFMLQAIDGLNHAHSREVFNCELKLENIFMRPDGSVAVGDFGLAVHGAQTPPGLRGTTGFVPPEAIHEALFAAGRDLNSTFLRVGMAQYMGLIPGVVQVVSPRQLPPCADRYVRYITSAMQLIRDPASRSEFSVDLTRRVTQSCLDDLVEQGLESLEECTIRQLRAKF